MTSNSLIEGLKTIEQVAAVIDRANSGELDNDPNVVAVRQFFVEDETRAYALLNGTLKSVGMLSIKADMDSGAEVMK